MMSGYLTLGLAALDTAVSFVVASRKAALKFDKQLPKPSPSSRSSWY